MSCKFSKTNPFTNFLYTNTLMKLANNQKQQPKRLIPLKRTSHLHQERKRIADDLHDEIGPMLAAIKLRMFTIKRMKNPLEISSTLDEITTDIDFLIQDVRKIIRNITPNWLERYGLIKSIEEFRNLIQKNNIDFDFLYDVSENDLNENARLNIYRIIMELINNSIKHSHCKIIKLFFKTYSDKTMIYYLDDGCKAKSIEGRQSGMGLKSMKARVEALRGKIYFTNDFQNEAFCQIQLDNKILFKY